MLNLQHRILAEIVHHRLTEGNKPVGSLKIDTSMNTNWPDKEGAKLY